MTTATGITRAAVLVPLVALPDPEVVLTRRAEHLPTHAGQISFPGGRHDPLRDESLLDTALREAEEEIGLRPDDAEILGALPSVLTLSSRFEISPFVCRLRSQTVFRADPGEVIEVFRMPLAALAPELRAEHAWEIESRRVTVPAVRFEGRLIWGATLRILDALAEARRDGTIVF